MVQTVGKNVRFYVQIEDTILDISGDVKSFSVNQNYADVSFLGDVSPTFLPSFMEAEIRIVGNGAWKTVEDFVIPKKQSEWRCDFCGHVNPMKARYCGHKDRHAVGCGARRSFLLDI